MSDTDFALRDDNYKIHHEQIVYVDGYAIAERLLEGVRFKVEVKPNIEGLSELICDSVHPEDAAYMEKFSEYQKSYWYDDAVKYLTDRDGDGEAPDGTNVHWSDYDGSE